MDSTMKEAPDKEIKSSTYLAKQFIITHIVQAQMQEADVLDYATLSGFTSYELELNDIMSAVDEMDKECTVEKVNSDKGVSIKLTEKGYKVFNKKV
jgi:hypothetical protein